MEQAIEIVKETVAFVEDVEQRAPAAARPQIVELAPADLDRVGGGIVGLFL